MELKMLFAIDENNKKILATPNSKAICPQCKQKVISKCGEINIWHWSHVNSADCDTWNEGETEWHWNWKSKFSGLSEIPIIKNGVMHRADICLPNGVVIEFQHSPISVKEIQERESFYERMIWVFDIQSACDPYWMEIISNPLKINGVQPDSGNFQIRGRLGINELCTFRWKHPRKSIAYAKSPVYLDLGFGNLFQLIKMYPNIPCGGKGYIRNRDEFIYNVILKANIR